MINRSRIVGLIHMAKNVARACPSCDKVSYRKRCPDCGTRTIKLDDKRYREILESFGASSCRFMDDAGLEKTYRFFLQAGFKPRENPLRRRQRTREQTIAITIAEAKRLFGDELWEKRLDGFVQKSIGKASLSACDDTELRKAIGWIRRYKKYLEKRSEEMNHEEGN